MSENRVIEKNKGKSFSLAVLSFILSLVAVTVSVLSWYFIIFSIVALLISLLSVIISVFLLSKERGGKIIPALSLICNIIPWIVVGIMLIGETYIYVSNYLGI